MFNKPSRIRLKIVVGKAPRFLRWEMPYFRKYFDLVDEADDETVVLAYATDVLEYATEFPCRLRVAVIFPGFGVKPYRIEADRLKMAGLFEKDYDLVFANPGPMEEVFRGNGKLVIHPFSVNLDAIPFKRPRRRLDSLLHASAVGSAKKDWMRSVEVMRLTGLKWEIFPPRPLDGEQDAAQVPPPDGIPAKIRQQLAVWRNRYWHPISRRALKWGFPDLIPPPGYAQHSALIKRYQQHDGFVHIAKENPPHTDAKYTATLFEAGATGALLFWHDALGLGNDFETIFSLPCEPELAANEILRIRREVDIERHSRRTAEEIRERCNPDAVVRTRLAHIERALNR